MLGLNTTRRKILEAKIRAATRAFSYLGSATNRVYVLLTTVYKETAKIFKTFIVLRHFFCIQSWSIFDSVFSWELLTTLKKGSDVDGCQCVCVGVEGVASYYSSKSVTLGQGV